jgi:hypothetical protein
LASSTCVRPAALRASRSSITIGDNVVSTRENIRLTGYTVKRIIHWQEQRAAGSLLRVHRTALGTSPKAGTRRIVRTSPRAQPRGGSHMFDEFYWTALDS